MRKNCEQVNLAWSGVNVTITPEFLDQMEVSKAIRKAKPLETIELQEP